MKWTPVFLFVLGLAASTARYLSNPFPDGSEDPGDAFPGCGENERDNTIVALLMASQSTGAGSRLASGLTLARLALSGR